MNDWVVIFETGQLYRAELVKSLLNDNNVEAVILNQKDSSFKIGAIEVMVKKEDKGKAAAIIKSVICGDTNSMYLYTSILFFCTFFYYKHYRIT